MNFWSRAFSPFLAFLAAAAIGTTITAAGADSGGVSEIRVYSFPRTTRTAPGARYRSPGDFLL